MAEGAPSASKNLMEVDGQVGVPDSKVEVEKKAANKEAAKFKIPEKCDMEPLFNFEDDRKCFSQITCETDDNLFFKLFSVTYSRVINEFKILRKFWGYGRILLL